MACHPLRDWHIDCTTSRGPTDRAPPDAAQEDSHGPDLHVPRVRRRAARAWPCVSRGRPVAARRRAFARDARPADGPDEVSGAGPPGPRGGPEGLEAEPGGGLHADGALPPAHRAGGGQDGVRRRRRGHRGRRQPDVASGRGRRRPDRPRQRRRRRARRRVPGVQGRHRQGEPQGSEQRHRVPGGQERRVRVLLLAARSPPGRDGRQDRGG